MQQKKSPGKNKKFSIYDSKRTAFFIGMFGFGILSMVILYPQTMLSFKQLVIICILFLSVDILVLKIKTKIKDLATMVGLTISILMAQVAILLWLNFIPIDSHIEKHRIESVEKFDSGILVQLENNAYSEYFAVRFAKSKRDFIRRDTVTYYFKDGLLGFKILEKTE